MIAIDANIKMTTVKSNLLLQSLTLFWNLQNTHNLIYLEIINFCFWLLALENFFD